MITFNSWIITRRFTYQQRLSLAQGHQAIIIKETPKSYKVKFICKDIEMIEWMPKSQMIERALDLNIGDKVKHKIFGVGVVKNLLPDRLLEIEFDKEIKYIQNSSAYIYRKEFTE